MRGRAHLLALLVGGLAVGGSTIVGFTPLPSTDRDPAVTQVAHAELVDAAPPIVLTQARDGTARDHDVRRDLAALLAITSALGFAGCSWLARQRQAPRGVSDAVATLRPRAPPLLPSAVHC